MVEETTAWTRLDADGVAVYGPCKVWGFIVKPGSSTEDVAIYDGRDATSGRPFITLRCALDGTTPFLFGKPVHFDRGVYVDFVGNIDEVTVLWEPVS